MSNLWRLNVIFWSCLSGVQFVDKLHRKGWTQKYSARLFVSIGWRSSLHTLLVPIIPTQKKQMPLFVVCLLFWTTYFTIFYWIFNSLPAQPSLKYLFLYLIFGSLETKQSLLLLSFRGPICWQTSLEAACSTAFKKI